MFFLDLFDSNITEEKAQIFSTSISSIESLHTDGNSIANLDLLTSCIDNFHENLTDLHLDVGGGDFRGDLMNYLQNSGIRLSTLELRKMSLPVDISQMCHLCPNLKRLKVIFSCVPSESPNPLKLVSHLPITFFSS